MSTRSVNNPRTTKREETIKGASKRSTARAKPASDAAASVRKGAKPEQKMTKEERKAARKAEREERNEVATVSDILLKRNAEYNKKRRVWWILMAIGLITAAASAGILQIPGARDSVNRTSVISIILLVIAYACIIGGLAWDLFKVAPLRNEAERQVSAMAPRRREAVLKQAGKLSDKDSEDDKDSKDGKDSKKGKDSKDGKGSKKGKDDKNRKNSKDGADASKE